MRRAFSFCQFTVIAPGHALLLPFALDMRGWRWRIRERAAQGIGWCPQRVT
jgi:hypothetical protein